LDRVPFLLKEYMEWPFGCQIQNNTFFMMQDIFSESLIPNFHSLENGAIYLEQSTKRPTTKIKPVNKIVNGLLK